MRDTKLNLKSFLLIGVGGSGCSAVKNFYKKDKSIPILLIDTDSESLASVENEKVFPVGSSVTNGFSCGGDVELGRQSIEKEASKLRSIFSNIDILLIVCGLGGGAATGITPVLARVSREVNTQSLFLVSLPFAFEGKQRMEISEDAIRRMRSNADAVVQLPNERLKRESKGKSSQVGFEISHKYMTDAAESLWGICNNSGYCGLDFASIHTILRSCDGFCHIASARSYELDHSTNIVNDLVNHPLMNKGLLLKGASGIVIFIHGSESMRIDEVELIMDNLCNYMSDDTHINFGVSVDKKIEGIKVVLLVTEEWRDPLIDNDSSIFSNRSGNSQGELAIETNINKGIFEDMDATVLNSEDYDVPTYIRKKIKLPR